MLSQQVSTGMTLDAKEKWDDSHRVREFGHKKAQRAALYFAASVAPIGARVSWFVALEIQCLLVANRNRLLADAEGRKKPVEHALVVDLASVFSVGVERS